MRCNALQVPFADDFCTHRLNFVKELPIVCVALCSVSSHMWLLMVDDPCPVTGLTLIPRALGQNDQFKLLSAIDAVVAKAPLYVPAMPKTGKPMSVQMTNCGPLGWVTCREFGYRYQPHHPMTNDPWPAMPSEIEQIWRDYSEIAAEPEACLINWYEPTAKLGLHVDRDEREFRAPVVSVSLGDDAWFRIGGLKRRDPTKRLLLKSGDVIVLSGAARLVHHGIDRIVPGTGKLLSRPGRYNLTLRRVTPITSCDELLASQTSR